MKADLLADFRLQLQIRNISSSRKCVSEQIVLQINHSVALYAINITYATDAIRNYLIFEYVCISSFVLVSICHMARN